MPAVTHPNWLELPRLTAPTAQALDRPIERLVTAPSLLEGAGFPVRRPFPSHEIGFRNADPFLLLDHLGAVEYAPGEAKGAPWHPHRGFETVTYIIDGVMQHRDSQGGGGLITNGATQWMTAGSGILHDELPTEELVRTGGLFHGIQLWVNLPSTLKWTPPRYQSLESHYVTLISSEHGDGLLRIIAGELNGHKGPGVTWTPVTVVHATLNPGAHLQIPLPQLFNTLIYILSGSGTVGSARVLMREGQGAQMGPGNTITITASTECSDTNPTMEVLLLGGQPIGEPIASYGPFVMNTHAEIVQAFSDYQEGRMGNVPAQEYRPDSL